MLLNMGMCTLIFELQLSEITRNVYMGLRDKIEKWELYTQVFVKSCR